MNRRLSHHPVVKRQGIMDTELNTDMNEMKVNWQGVFPAMTMQFRQDGSLDLPATAKHLETMIGAGIHGVILLGSVGENTALEYHEKLAVLKEMSQVVRGR